MGIVILHGGQTGVDRGAHVGAVDNGWSVRGVMPKNGRDELGLIPASVSQHLERCIDSGFPARTRANVKICQLVLISVPDRDDPRATRGTSLTLDIATELARPRLVIQPTIPDDVEKAAEWIAAQRSRLFGSATASGRELRLMVAGPRASRWSSGQAETAGFLRRLKLFLSPPKSDDEITLIP